VFPGERLGRPAYGAAEDEVPAARSHAKRHDPIGFWPDIRGSSSTAASADPRSGNLGRGNPRITWSARRQAPGTTGPCGPDGHPLLRWSGGPWSPWPPWSAGP